MRQPHTSAAKRQPNGVNPKMRMPLAMSHLPPGGCTTPPFSTPRRSISAASGGVVDLVEDERPRVGQARQPRGGRADHQRDGNGDVEPRALSPGHDPGTVVVVVVVVVVVAALGPNSDDSTRGFVLQSSSGWRAVSVDRFGSCRLYVDGPGAARARSRTPTGCRGSGRRSRGAPPAAACCRTGCARSGWCTRVRTPPAPGDRDSAASRNRRARARRSWPPRISTRRGRDRGEARRVTVLPALSRGIAEPAQARWRLI